MEHFGFPLEVIAIFFSVIILSVYMDLAAHRNSEEITVRDAAAWSIFWVALALAFYGYLWQRFSKDWADLYLAGYVLEKSLSVDNLMVFIAIFAAFKISGPLQHRILYWGILGAIVFRAIFVSVGTGFFAAAESIGFLFAAAVAISALGMLSSGWWGKIGGIIVSGLILAACLGFATVIWQDEVLRQLSLSSFVTRVVPMVLAGLFLAYLLWQVLKRAAKMFSGDGFGLWENLGFATLLLLGIMLSAAYLIFITVTVSFALLAQILAGLLLAWLLWITIRQVSRLFYAIETEDEDDEEDYTNHKSVKLTGWLMPVYPKLYSKSFFVRHSELERNGDLAIVTRRGVLYATPAFLCLMAIETSDIVFAFDSVPAVIAVTQEPLLVYAAMIFAILGLRSLYFILAALTRYLIHLEKAVVALLFFIAGKMILQAWNHAIGDTRIHIEPNESLVIILGVLLLGVIASLFSKKSPPDETAPR